MGSRRLELAVLGVIRTCATCAWLAYLMCNAVEKLTGSRPPRAQKCFGDLSPADSEHIDKIIENIKSQPGEAARAHPCQVAEARTTWGLQAEELRFFRGRAGVCLRRDVAFLRNAWNIASTT